MLIPDTKEMKEKAYQKRFTSWIGLHPEQAKLFCEHGFYHGGSKLGSYIHRCIICKGGKDGSFHG